MRRRPSSGKPHPRIQLDHRGKNAPWPPRLGYLVSDTSNPQRPAPVVWPLDVRGRHIRGRPARRAVPARDSLTRGVPAHSRHQVRPEPAPHGPGRRRPRRCHRRCRDPRRPVARARPDPASPTVPVASHGRPGRQRVRQQRAAGTRRSAMPATNGRHGARSKDQVPRTERWATPSDSRRVLACLRSHEPNLRPGTFAVLRMAVPAPAAWWLRGNARMPDPGLQGQPSPAGGQSPRPFCFCGQQARLGRRP
jgi:hypothetical protein